MSCRILVLLALMTYGCGSQPAPASVASSVTPTVSIEPGPHASAGAPLAVRWVVGGVGATSATLTARVERFVPFTAPLHVELRLPAGAQLARPQSSALAVSSVRLATTDLAPNATATVDSIQVDLAYTSLPADDLVIVIDAQAPGGGVHAEVPYRFGRSEPTEPSPQPTGQRIVVGGRDFGSAVPAAGR